MTTKLPEKWIAVLNKLPESGMGSHHVEIHLNSGKIIRNVTVFNSEDCQSDTEFDPHEIKEIRESQAPQQLC